MIDPAYHDIPAEKIPQVDFEGGNAKIISGSYQGIKGPGKPHTGMLYHNIYLKPDALFEMKIENGWNVFIYIYEGSMVLDQTIPKGRLIVFEQSGDLILDAGPEGAQFIVVAGEPIHEPVARGGPFVMNTRGEILQAFDDYQKGVLDKPV
jgi:hypothetical protein